MASAVASLLALGAALAPPVATAAEAPQPAPQAPATATAPPAWHAQLTDAARANRYRMSLDGALYSGPAWDRLAGEAAAAHFILLGEEHGIAQWPALAAQLFETVAKQADAKFVIEVSPPMAAALDDAARGGIDGLKDMLLAPEGGAAFFTMQEEAAMLARIRAARPGPAHVLWGVDYEVFGDRMLIDRLLAMPKPASARAALDALRVASRKARADYEAQHDPGLLFSFSGDPALVGAVRGSWPDAPPDALRILRALQATLEINALWVQGKGYASNVARAAFLRENLLAHWKAERAAGRMPKVVAKLGASHLVRGRSSTEAWDIGALAPEIAAIEGVEALQVVVLPGLASQVAVFDPVAWRYRDAPAKDGYSRGVEPILAAAFDDGYTLFDLRPLRAIVGGTADADPQLLRTVHGYDLLLLMTGSTPSRNLQR